jgi:class 3 adenylate cyclase/tetratricopeptide (TPR) repeat protein
LSPRLGRTETVVATMQQIADWLNTLGLGQYAQRFAENYIDASILRDLTDQDLEKIGIPLGHRKKLLRAILALADASAAAPPTATASEPIPHDSAERRQLTVMFTDLVGSTALSTTLDPEDLQKIIGAYHRCCAKVITQSGGFVARYLGDGVLAYFGYPQAHEDDAEQAVRAGLALVEAVAKLDAGQASSLHVRVGIATGLVVVGDLMGGDAAHENEVVGETPNLAARLQALAEPDAVDIESGTRRLLGGLFDYSDLGAVPVKGFGGSVQVWRVLGASSVASRFEALRAATTPLVGREEEIALLMRRWQQASTGEGCVVLMSGEPGIGKSRIAQTVLERLSGEPHTRLRYFCSPHHQDSALYPSITQLERAAGFRRDDTGEQRLDKLEAVLALGTNDLSKAVPLLADLLSISTGDRYPPLNLTPQKRKEKTLHAQLGQVEGLAARQPVLMVFEDIHWSDPTTRESLDLLIDRVPALRIMVIITFRPEFAPPWLGRPQVTLLSLNRLSPRQRAEMIMGVTGGKALPSEIANQIIDRTDGVPLFIEELTKSVVESGLVTKAGDLYTMRGPVMPLAIPTTLHASLLARLDRLAPTREVAQIGAALGRSFFHELITAVAGMPQQQLDDALQQLVRAELVFQRGAPPDAEYTFKHALVQDAAYSTLLRSRRQQLHGRIATTLESQFAEIVTAQPQLMAQHCAQAGLNEKAVGYWLKAGQQAVARSAITEAVAQLQKGLDLLASRPDGDWRRQQELELRLALARALIAAKGYAAPVVGETFARARVLAEQLDRSDYLVRLLWGRGAFHLVRSELRLALSLAEQMERFGETQNDVALRLLGHYQHGSIRCFLGEFVAARALFEQFDRLDDPAHRAVYAALTAEHPYAVTPGTLALTLTPLGYIDQGRSRIDEALTLARRLGHVYSLVFVLSWAVKIDLATGSAHEAQRHAEEMVALSNEHGFPYYLAWGTVHRGMALTALGQAQGGLTLITKGLSMVRATGAVLGTPSILTKLAEAHRRLGQSGEGLNCLAEAAQIIEATDERRDEAELHRVRGDLLNATGDQATVEQRYHQALAVARRQSAKLFELRAATSLARLWRDQSRRAEARDLLAPIYGWFTEGLDTPVLREANALLEQLAE